MAATALKAHWYCREPGCPEEGEGSAKAADKAARDHAKATRHATTSWAEPPLPIEVRAGVTENRAFEGAGLHRPPRPW